jgi:hypothetical protein
MRPILGGETGNVAIIMSFDPFGGEVEASPNGDFEVWEVCVFNIPFRGLVIGFLVIGHFISESSDLLTKSVFHLMVDRFMGPDGFEQSVADRTQCNCVNVVPNGIEGCDNHTRGEWLAT